LNLIDYAKNSLPQISDGKDARTSSNAVWDDLNKARVLEELIRLNPEVFSNYYERIKETARTQARDIYPLLNAINLAENHQGKLVAGTAATAALSVGAIAYYTGASMAAAAVGTVAAAAFPAISVGGVWYYLSGDIYLPDTLSIASRQSILSAGVDYDREIMAYQLTYQQIGSLQSSVPGTFENTARLPQPEIIETQQIFAPPPEDASDNEWLTYASNSILRYQKKTLRSLAIDHASEIMEGGVRYVGAPWLNDLVTIMPNSRLSKIDMAEAKILEIIITDMQQYIKTVSKYAFPQINHNVERQANGRIWFSKDDDVKFVDPIIEAHLKSDAFKIDVYANEYLINNPPYSGYSFNSLKINELVDFLSSNDITMGSLPHDYKQRYQQAAEKILAEKNKK
jgi:hypothetical protein